MNLEFVEGYTGPVALQLLADGKGLDITGFPVPEVILKDKNGAAIDTAGDVVVSEPKQGRLTYTPDPTDLLAASTPHTLRVKVTDGSGVVRFFPGGAAATVRIYAP